jgi:HTH-type transcriptional regulator/antitoxin HipB
MTSPAVPDPLKVPLTILFQPLQIGRLLRARRKRLGLTQEQLARRLGISQNRLSDLERSPEHITLDRMLEWTYALGLNLFTSTERSPKTPVLNAAAGAIPDDEIW